MKKIRIFAWAPALTLIAFCMYFATAASPQSTAVNQTKSIVTATTAFLNSLSAAHREKVQFPFTPEKTATAAKFARTAMGKGPGGGGNGPGVAPPGPGGAGPGGGGMGPGGGFVGEQYGKAVWSNYPVSDVPRPGLTLGSLSAAQRDAAMHMMRVLLSNRGYQKFSKPWVPIRPFRMLEHPSHPAWTPTRSVSSVSRASHRTGCCSTAGIISR